MALQKSLNTIIDRKKAKPKKILRLITTSRPTTDQEKINETYNGKLEKIRKRKSRRF